MTARTFFAAGVVVGAALPLWAAPALAQAPAAPAAAAAQVAPDQIPNGTTPEGATPLAVDPALHYPVRQMEGVLINAVKQGAQNLAQELSQVVPNLQMFTGRASAHGFPDPGQGVTFVVEVPLINGVAIQVYSQVNEGPPVGSGTVTPAAVSKVEAAHSALLSDPNEAYRVRVREALIDAMLDYGGTIPLGTDEWLTVVARSVDTGFNSNDDVTSILRITGADLAAFKAGKLTREQAHKRVQLIEF